MKKTLLFFALISLVSLGFAQMRSEKIYPSADLLKKNKFDDGEVTHIIKTHNLPANNTPAAVIWTDDFSTTANWTMSNTGAPPQNWVISTTIPVTLTNQGFARPAAPSAGNFAYYDSDRGATSSGTTDNANLTTATSINLTGHPDVILEFYENYRKYNDSTYVYVSTNGTSWTGYEVNSTVPASSNTTNPQLVRLNISQVAGNQPTVWIRFNYGGAWDWFWMIDNVQIVDAPANDLELSLAYTDFNYTDGGTYTKVPIVQAGPINFRGAIYNNGATTQNQIKMNVTINRNSTPVYNQDSPILDSLPKLLHDTLKIATPAYTPDLKANYSTVYTVSQTQTDGTPLNNTTTFPFEVTDTVYARDNGSYATATRTSPSYYTGGDDGSVLANLYEFNQKAEANSISVMLYATNNTSGANKVGTNFTGKIYKLSDNSEIISTNVYNIDTDIPTGGAWVTLPFNKIGTNAVLEQDTAYIVGVEVGGTSTGDIVMANDVTTHQPDQTTFLYVSGSGTWFFTNNCPFIRLNVHTGVVGIDETIEKNKVQLYQNEPNPARNFSVIRYDLSAPSDVLVEVRDILGKTVMYSEQGKKPEGSHSFTIDIKNLESGLYFYTVTTNHFSITKKMIVEQ